MKAIDGAERLMMRMSERLPANEHRILVLGSFGFGNLGDEAILSMLLDDLAGRDLTVVSRDPDATRAMHGVRAVQAVSPASGWAAWRADALVLGGGGVFSGLGGKLTKGLAYYMRGFQAIGKAIHFHALGIYPDTDPATLRILLPVLRKARTLSVRDETSHTFLESLGIPSTQIPDPVTALEPLGREAAVKALEAEGIDAGRPWIGVSPRRVRKNQEHLERELLGALRALQARGHPILFLPTAHFPYGTYTNDLHFSRELAAKLDPQLTGVVAGLHHPKLAAALFRIPRVHVPMRLHAMIFASRVGRPSTAIAYADKVADVADELGIGHVSIPELNADDLVRRVEGLL